MQRRQHTPRKHKACDTDYTRDLANAHGRDTRRTRETHTAHIQHTHNNTHIPQVRARTSPLISLGPFPTWAGGGLLARAQHQPLIPSARLEGTERHAEERVFPVHFQQSF